MIISFNILIQLKKKKSQNVERTVLQFHYTNWPDHGTPEHPLPILSFVRQSASANPIGAGPIIVHCSAGVGRTGEKNTNQSMLIDDQSKYGIIAFSFISQQERTLF